MPHRRSVMADAARLAALLLASGVVPAFAQATPRTAAWASRNIADALKASGAGAPVESTGVQLAAPEVAENGAAVPITLGATLPGVRRLLLLVEKNPAVLSAVFEPSDAVEASFGTRVKMGQSSMVWAVALMADGRTLYAQRDVKVTLGGCAG